MPASRGSAVPRGKRLSVDKEAPGSHFGPMKQVGLKVLKNKLSEYVRAAAAGETVVITDRGHPIAQISPPLRDIPIGEGRPLSVFELRGMPEGWLRPATIRDGTPPPGKAVEGLTFDRLMEDLARDREDRV